MHSYGWWATRSWQERCPSCHPDATVRRLWMRAEPVHRWVSPERSSHAASPHPPPVAQCFQMRMRVAHGACMVRGGSWCVCAVWCRMSGACVVPHGAWPNACCTGNEVACAWGECVAEAHLRNKTARGSVLHALKHLCAPCMVHG